MIKAVAFYPEYTEQSKWEESLSKIKEGNIEAIRFGEFAWGLVEPDEGRFNWSVFDAAFDLTESMGIKIILCTPTACPPVWLTQKYPGILPVNDKSEKVGFGGRQHRCYNSADYRDATKRIVKALAERYGKRNNLYAWQIDNELGAEMKYCYCDTCRKKYQDFLKDKYCRIEDLNKRWLTTFWAQNYNGFEQIPVPVRIDNYLPLRHHPSLVYEFLRFSSNSIVDYAHMQAELIRRYSDRIVTTNQDDFCMGDNTNWYHMYDDLDVVGFDIYTKNLYEIGFYYDFARSVKQKPFWQMEFDSNSPVLSDVLDMGMQKGLELMGLFKFEPFPAGQEQSMAALVDTLGYKQPNYYTFRDWEAPSMAYDTHEIKKVYMLYDFDSSLAYAASEYRTWETGFDQKLSWLVYQRYVIHTVYKSIFTRGIGVDFIRSPDEVDPHTPLILPMLILDKGHAFTNGLLKYMECGGHIIATNDLFTKNADNAYCSEVPALYKTLGDKPEFIYSPGNTEQANPVLRETIYGKGKIWLVDKNANENGWGNIINGVLA